MYSGCEIANGSEIDTLNWKMTEKMCSACYASISQSTNSSFQHDRYDKAFLLAEAMCPVNQRSPSQSLP